LGYNGGVKEIDQANKAHVSSMGIKVFLLHCIQTCIKHLW